MNLRISLFALCLITVGLFSCEEDKNGDNPNFQSNVRFEITDAPIDDTNVQGAFVTVAEIRVDGQTFTEFEGKQTIDLLAYQNGNTELLAEGRLDASAYSNIELVLDQNEDADGNSPGCYILTTDNEKVALSGSGSSELVISNEQEDIVVEDEGESTVIIDFDLRKAIQRGEQEGEYSFVAQTELETAVRINEKDRTGMVKGECQNAFDYSEKVVVYAYAEGTFDKETEVNGNGNIQFQNAVNSTSVKANGSYKLHFLQPGSYELFFAGYEDEDGDGEVEFAGSLELDLLINLGVVDVTANSSSQLNLVFTGLIP